jgi:hypothetical protein
VDGVWSADPRSVPEAVKLDALSLDEALAMARNGAKVLYEEAVAWAKREGVTLRASRAGGEGTGTTVSAQAFGPRAVAVVSDSQLAEGPHSLLAVLPGVCVRAADEQGLLVDLRNLHAPVGGLAPIATVAVIGERAGADPQVLGRTLAAAATHAAGRASRWSAVADAIVFRVKSSEAASLERHLHLELAAVSGTQPAP